MAIYFIQQGDDGPIKIGYTKDPAARLEKLQTANPHKLHLIGTMLGDAPREAALHAYLADWRLEGEWFAPAPEVHAVIRQATCRDQSTAGIYGKSAEVELLAARVRKYAGKPRAEEPLAKIRELLASRPEAAPAAAEG